LVRFIRPLFPYSLPPYSCPFTILHYQFTINLFFCAQSQGRERPVRFPDPTFALYLCLFLTCHSCVSRNLLYFTFSFPLSRVNLC
jgi:hypothetical protein